MPMIKKSLIFLFICLFITSCYSPVQDIDYGKELNKNGKIAVMSFGVSKEIGLENYKNLSESVPRALYEKTVDKYSGNLSFVSIEDSLKIAVATEVNSSIKDYQINALESAKSLGADLILVGYIYDFKQRVGSELGVTSPAQVDFETALVEVGTNQTVWSARFSESQLPLLYNVANLKKFLKRKGKWVTAEDLLDEGINAVSEKLIIYLRTN